MLKPALITLAFFVSAHSLAIDETSVEIIPLAPPLDQAEIELSGLSWCGDKLILMPQYPKRFAADGNSYFYYLEQQQISNYLDRVSTEALQADAIRVDEKQLRTAVSSFDGFEAIACKDKALWLAIESVDETETYRSFAVQGSISFDQPPHIKLDPNSLTLLESQSKMRNIGDEAIVMQGDNVLAIHEVNDPRAVSSPQARHVSNRTQLVTDIKFPHLPFRITDATALDTDNHFWVINYKYSGDEFSRQANDLIRERYGQGTSHKQYYNVERLIELKLENGEITLIESPPIQLEMNDVEGRNWEGLVRLKDRGFLVVTDKHPSTLFGFVPYAE